MTTRSLLFILPVFSLLPACGPHTIQGRVVQGDTSYITVVDNDDPRFESETGITGALLKLQLEPGRINRRVVAEQTSGANGEFSLPVDEFGAGVLEVECGLLARRRGFKSAEGVFMMPGGSKQILVVLQPGRDAPGDFEEEPSAQEQIERYR